MLADIFRLASADSHLRGQWLREMATVCQCWRHACLPLGWRSLVLRGVEALRELMGIEERAARVKAFTQVLDIMEIDIRQFREVCTMVADNAKCLRGIVLGVRPDCGECPEIRDSDGAIRPRSWAPGDEQLVFPALQLLGTSLETFGLYFCPYVWPDKFGVATDMSDLMSFLGRQHSLVTLDVMIGRNANTGQNPMTQTTPSLERLRCTPEGLAALVQSIEDSDAPPNNLRDLWIDGYTYSRELWYHADSGTDREPASLLSPMSCEDWVECLRACVASGRWPYRKTRSLRLEYVAVNAQIMRHIVEGFQYLVSLDLFCGVDGWAAPNDPFWFVAAETANQYSTSLLPYLGQLACLEILHVGKGRPNGDRGALVPINVIWAGRIVRACRQLKRLGLGVCSSGLGVHFDMCLSCGYWWTNGRLSEETSEYRDCKWEEVSQELPVTRTRTTELANGKVQWNEGSVVQEKHQCPACPAQPPRCEDTWRRVTWSREFSQGLSA